MSTEHVISEIWGEIKRYINTVDKEEAADILVSVMIDNDCDPDDIKTAFKNDPDVKSALKSYINENFSDEDEEIEDEEDEDYNADWED